MQPETIEIVTPRTTFRVEGYCSQGVACLTFSAGRSQINVSLTPGEMNTLIGGLRTMQQKIWSHHDGRAE